MPHKFDYGFLAISAITLSLIGAALVLPLTLYKSTPPWSLAWRKQLIGALLALICISGILAALFPDKCSKTFHSRKRKKTQNLKVKNLNPSMESVHFRGHHPDCGNFDAHIIRLNRRVLCAACTGLLFGGVLVLAGTASYFFLEVNFLGKPGLWSVLAGQIGIVLGFFQFKFKGFTRSFMNTLFVFSCFLVLVGVDALAENLLIDLYLICLIIFWLFTRILLSQWDHLQICRRCKIPCELAFAA
ncbi:MAG: hypothetical protein RMJ15_04800 [Nitrososphaerota archaeon]|nr:hypothetical protein [Candidatus Bathyarchaeota archaeon]MDW8023037.1 hypothetical protein [Nitrososphaerota archaeon]